MPDTNYSVRFVESEKDIPAELWAACFPAPLEGHWWYRTLEASGLEHQFDFFYALLLRDGKPIGIAPMFVMDLEVEFLIPRPLIPFLAWLGKMLPALSAPKVVMIGSPCSDEGTVGLLPDADRRAAFSALQDAVEAEAQRRNVSLIVWKDFPATYDADLKWLAGHAGLFRVVSFPGTVIALPGPRKEDYFASLTTSRRYNLKKKLKRSAQIFDSVVEAVQNPDAATIDELYALFEQTRARAKTTFEDLDRRFFEQIAKEPVSHFVILRERETGRAVAFDLCFASGDYVINKYIGIDYGRPKDWFLYFRLTDAIVDWALSRGAKFIQSGQTGYSAKLEQGHTLYPLTSYGKHRNAALHGICKWVVPRIGWATLDADLAAYVRAHPDAELISR
jgi:hypothetical protein